MPKFVIERTVPGADNWSAEEMQAVSNKSCDVLRELGPEIQWVQSYVTNDKLFCLYYAPNAEMIRRHAEMGGFPADEIREVTAVIDPTTAESTAA